MEAVLSVWCPVCGERYTGREADHANECPGFRHIPRRIRQDDGDPGGGYRLNLRATQSHSPVADDQEAIQPPRSRPAANQ
jgi:hypothetical protein